MHLLTYASYCSHLHIGWHGACLVTEFAPTVRATSGQGGTPDGREQTANDRGAGRRPAAQSGRVWGCVVFTIVIYCVYYSVQWPSMYSSGTPLTRSTEFGVGRTRERCLFSCGSRGRTAGEGACVFTCRSPALCWARSSIGKRRGRDLKNPRHAFQELIVLEHTYVVHLSGERLEQHPLYFLSLESER